MLDPTLPLTVLDYEEFGDPNIPAEFEAICSYSPYDNLSSGVCYPPVLVTASFNDTRFFSPSISILFQTWWIICIYLFHVNCELTFFLLIFPLHVSFLVSSSFPSWFDRVGIWEAAKWVAKVRDITCRSCSKSVILKTNMQSGHFGEGGRFMHCDETALDYAFLMKALQLDDITIA